MKPFIFTERNGIHIIDLQQTVKMLTTAYNLIRDAVAAGGTVLFVGTKRQAQETIATEAARCGMPYVTERWMGGMLTNWSTMYKRIQQLDRLEKMRESGELERLTKKEGLLIGREIERLKIRLSGARSMTRLPDLLFVVDVMREDAAVHEANLLNLPIVALVDTNCNPNNIDYIIPSNDDAIRAIKLLVAKVADAVLEGKALRKEEEPEQAAEAAFEAGDAEARRAAHPAESEETELEDGELLGQSTLDKMSRQAEAEAAQKVAVESAAAEKAAVEATTTETVEPAPAAAEAVPPAEAPAKEEAKPRKRAAKTETQEEA